MTSVALDFECSMLPFSFPWQREAFVVCLSTCDENMNRRTWFFDHEDATQTPRDSINEINEYLSGFKRIIAHNLKYDMHWLRALNINTENHVLWCTMVVEYLIRRHGNLQELSLAELSAHYGLPPKKDKVKIYWDAGVNTDKIPSDILQIYCEQDTVNAMLIFKKQQSQANQMNLAKLISLEMSVIRCYADMEWNGMAIDLLLCDKFAEEAEEQLTAMDNELMELMGIPSITPANLSAGLFGGTLTEEYYGPVLDESGEKIYFKSGARKGEVKEKKYQKEWYVEGVGFDPTKYKIPMTARQGVYSVSKETVLPLLKPSTPEQKRVLEILFERSKLSKLKTAYFDSFPALAVDGCVRSNINQALTKTGRLSSSQPNLQNIPRGSSPVKQLFISR